MATKYLLHSDSATFDATSKKWFFNLEQRITNPRVIRLAQASFTTAGDTSPHPAVVYLRSDAISRMCQRKHTVSLKDAGHNNDTNILAVLTETHTRGRYSMNAGRSFGVHKHNYERAIDIYFTSGETILEGTYGSAPVSGSTGDDAAIIAIPDLKMWVDMEPGNLLDAAYANATAFGDPVRYIYQNSNSEVNTFTGLGDFDLTQWGSNGARGLSSQVSWQFASENAGSNWLPQEDFTIVMGLRAPSTALSGIHRLYDFWYIDTYIEMGVFSIKDVNGNRNSTGMTVVPTKDYIFTVRRVDTNGDGTYLFESRAERLDNNVISTGTPLAVGKAVNQQQAYYFSKPNEHFLGQDGIFSYFIFFLGGDDGTHVAEAETWIRNKYNGTSTESSSESASGEDATFFLELDITQG